jgi:2-polyprenyl-3-methyl-5-hydroxy-6-metoxy-1,4-benzoquinol methylase
MPDAMSRADDWIARNVAAHDAVARTYDMRHPEIFNAVEQARLAAAVHEAVQAVPPSASGAPLRVLDIGTGTGNLTAHFLAAGAHVTAADVSPKCLHVVAEKFGGPRLATALLDGRGLSSFADGAFDIVACYSVLHHVPNYAALVLEMARVVRPGGAVFIDHERHDASWLPDPARDAFLAEAVVWPPRTWRRFLKPGNYWKRLRPLLSWRRWRDARWMPEGDLHIWPDDHIEWARVEAAAAVHGVRPVIVRDYLLYEPRYRRDAWERWRDRASDYRLWIGRKS